MGTPTLREDLAFLGSFVTCYMEGADDVKNGQAAIERLDQFLRRAERTAVVGGRAGTDFIGTSVEFICVSKDNGKFLTHKRGPDCSNGLGLWDFGSGKVEFGEDPADAVRREVPEEFGCQVLALEQLCSISHSMELDGERVHWCTTPFVVLVDPKEVRSMEPGKVTELTWCSLYDTPSPLHPMTTRLLEAQRMQIDDAANSLRIIQGVLDSKS